MASDPSSGPGAGVVASQQTAISSAQIKALFTTPVTVSPTPRSDQVIVPLRWCAVAADSATVYENPGTTNLILLFDPTLELLDMGKLLSELSRGNPSFLVTDETLYVDVVDLAYAAGLPLKLWCDIANLTDGDFGITFTLFYAIVPAS